MIRCNWNFCVILDRHTLKFTLFCDISWRHISSRENCTVAVFEFERIIWVAELNEGCRRVRLLRDRCCHGNTNPVLWSFAIPPERDSSDRQGGRDPYLLTFEWPFCIYIYRRIIPNVGRLILISINCGYFCLCLILFRMFMFLLLR